MKLLEQYDTSGFIKDSLGETNFNKLSDHIQRRLKQSYKDGYKQCQLDRKEDDEHYDKKLLDGFAHPKDCNICAIEEGE